jgi:hypothetical protein
VGCDFQAALTAAIRKGAAMNIEKIKVRVTETGQTMEVVVYDKRASSIQVVLGEGVHSVKCELTPTRTGLAYAGSAMGREIVYERSREQVQADIDRLNPTLREYKRR